ncbi:GTP binding protein [Aureococcus anophagefferens]|nr:GTP binding protein [Aureococcus anophagefferens]
MRRRALSATPSWSRVAPSVWAHGVDVGAPAAPRTTHRVFGGPAAFVPPRAFGYELPTSGVPEVAFAGRSNVGKSTLVGALLGDPALLAPKTPGADVAKTGFGVSDAAATLATSCRYAVG